MEKANVGTQSAGANGIVTLATLKALLRSEPPVGSEIAEACQYDARVLAAQCGCSLRRIERVFRPSGRTPHLWLREQKGLRDLRLLESLADTGELRSIKRLAIDLGYRRPDNFIRDFRRIFLLPPRRFLVEREKALKNLGLRLSGRSAV